MKQSGRRIGDRAEIFSGSWALQDGIYVVPSRRVNKEPGSRGKETVNLVPLSFIIKAEWARYNSNSSEIYGTGGRGGP